MADREQIKEHYEMQSAALLWAVAAGAAIANKEFQKALMSEVDWAHNCPDGRIRVLLSAAAGKDEMPAVSFELGVEMQAGETLLQAALRTLKEQDEAKEIKSVLHFLLTRPHKSKAKVAGFLRQAAEKLEPKAKGGPKDEPR